ncbi:MAG: hypothetical protein NC938_04645 [Candidatus Omnitrophica bacterium]|nr:hypothetical protein [Candidatus Omnitrophota bacterium]MCM8790972.1 hypothetical protein [Candidatus Omnitrophota bacterium]
MKPVFGIFARLTNKVGLRIKDSVIAGTNICYTRYPNGNIQSQLIIDACGTPLDYVHFMDVAPPRPDKSINFSLGTSYTYSYYDPVAGRFKSVVYFKDTDWARFAAIFTFYNDETNHRQSMRLAVPDTEGNVYYHYMDDEVLTDSDIAGDYWGPGSSFCGRVNKAVRAWPDMEGAVAYEYVYYPGTEKIHYKKCYASAYWYDDSDPETGGLVSVVIYNPNGEILKEVRSATIQADAQAA